jgi:hypothetical protein
MIKRHDAKLEHSEWYQDSDIWIEENNEYMNHTRTNMSSV